ncbi:MAG TPA: flagellar hook-length control protein FliK, partial [Gammaproteobacteria bacterium]|nr:flagellar hook-length control protein FliK [Gammaproteobacteria bacterium]
APPMIDFRPVDFLLNALQAKGGPPGAVNPPGAVAPTKPAAALPDHSTRPHDRQPPAANPAAAHPAPAGHDEGAAPGPAAHRVSNRGDTAAARPTNGAAPPAANADSAASENTALLLRLSAVARLLGDAVAAGRGATPAIRPSAPLLSQPPPVAAELAPALQRSIADSGLFYESHLAQWTLQQYPQQQLQSEPQAQWHGILTAADAAATGSGMAASAQQSNAIMPPLPDHAASLLRLQLQTLVAQQIVWQGEPWPGQEASIHIADDSPAAHTGVQKTWRTRLELTLPVLGTVNASVALTGQHLDVTLRSDSGESAERLRATAQSLATALDARAFDVAAIRIEHGDTS